MSDRGSAWLARRARCGYAASMHTRHIFSLILAVSLAACGDSHKPPPKRTAKSNGSSGIQDVGRKTEKTFRGVGGSLEKFFTGHDTISR